jgi:hypothetical protein
MPPPPLVDAQPLPMCPLQPDNRAGDQPMSDLRERIARIVDCSADADEGACCDECRTGEFAPSSWALGIADVLIRELGLKRESNRDGFEPIDDVPAGVYRYVTDFREAE